eukprot:960748-Rhodomonas_salina.1
MEGETVDSFNATKQGIFLLALTDVMGIPSGVARITGVTANRGRSLSLAVQVEITLSFTNNTAEELIGQIQFVIVSGDLVARAGTLGFVTKIGLLSRPEVLDEASLTEEVSVVPHEQVPQVIAFIKIEGETVDSFDSNKQSTFARELAQLVGLDPIHVSITNMATDLKRLELSQSRVLNAAVDSISVRVELLVPAQSNLTLAEVVSSVSTAVSDGTLVSALATKGIAVSLVVEAGPAPFFPPDPLPTVTTAIGLSTGTVESFNASQQALFVAAVAQEVGVEASDVTIISVEGRPGRELSLSVTVEITPGKSDTGNITTNVTAEDVATSLLASVLDGTLATTLETVGVQASVGLLAQVEVSVGALPYTAPTIATRTDRAVEMVVGL